MLHGVKGILKFDRLLKRGSHIVTVRYPPEHQSIYGHECEEEMLQIPLMQCVWVEVT